MFTNVATKGIQQYYSLFNRGSKRGVTKIALGFEGRTFLTPIPRVSLLEGKKRDPGDEVGTF